MEAIDRLFENNRRWAAERTAQDPEFFSGLAHQQAPDYLWIGCSDSRIPANQVIGLDPGEVFVHRNVANLVVNTDLNCLSVIQYAVEFLGVNHIIVCGHYGCGGVRAAMNPQQLGLVDNWLREIRDIRATHREELEAIGDRAARYDRLVELNALRQAANVGQTTIVQNAWARGHSLTIHAWAYRLEDGLLRDLGLRLEDPGALSEIYRMKP